MRAKEASQTLGFSIDTLKRLEEKGLIPAPRRNHAGHQSITVGNPRWVARMTRYCTEPGPEQARFCKLAERYWFAMPQSIQEAVLVAKARRKKGGGF